MTVTASPIATRKPLLGLATLMTQAFRGTDLRPLAQALIDRAAADEDDAEALMDLSTALFLQGLREVGLPPRRRRCRSAACTGWRRRARRPRAGRCGCWR